MAFTEKTKFEIKRKSHQFCCVCRQVGVEIHHIIPQSEGGPDTEENAAPLCPSCHEIFGANPTKRKFIKESKEIWFSTCETLYSNESLLLLKLSERVGNLEKHLGLDTQTIYASINNSQKNIEESQDNQDLLMSTLNVLMKVPHPSLEDTEYFAGFHVTYLMVYEARGDRTKESKRFNFIRDRFLAIYGRLVAEKLILHQMNVYKIDWINGVPETDLARFMVACKLFMISFLRDPTLKSKGIATDISFTPDELEIIEDGFDD